jgi:hypothetical protein
MRAVIFELSRLSEAFVGPAKGREREDHGIKPLVIPKFREVESDRRWMATNAWIVKRLSMGRPTRAYMLVRENYVTYTTNPFRATPNTVALVRQLEFYPLETVRLCTGSGRC